MENQSKYFQLLFLFLFFVLLYNTVLVLLYNDMNPARVYMSSQSRTPLPPLSPYHLSGSSQCASPKHPVSCIETRLVIRFLHDSTCFNAILPNHPTLSLSHRVQKTVLNICVSFAVSHTGLSLPSFSIPYICVSILYWWFSFWLTSLCIIGFSFIHLNRTD